MRYFIDTEFNDRTRPGSAFAQVELISIGVVAEDGREVYAEVAGFDWDRAAVDPWLLDNVRPHLLGGAAVKPADEIAAMIEQLTDDDDRPQFWAYIASYDWLAMISLFGPLSARPYGWPMAIRDLRQVMDDRGIFKDDILPMTGTAHSALDDARWLRDAMAALHSRAPHPAPTTGGAGPILPA